MNLQKIDFKKGFKWKNYIPEIYIKNILYNVYFGLIMIRCACLSTCLCVVITSPLKLHLIGQPSLPYYTYVTLVSILPRQWGTSGNKYQNVCLCVFESKSRNCCHTSSEWQSFFLLPSSNLLPKLRTTANRSPRLVSFRWCRCAANTQLKNLYRE